MKPFHIIWGKVKAGSKRGKRLGIPTANISLHKNIPQGVYVSMVIIDSREYQAATFIGSAKTFGEKDTKAESYILDFNKNIYGNWITIKLFKKLRTNKKFESKDALVTQMKKDILNTREFFIHSF